MRAIWLLTLFALKALAAGSISGTVVDGVSHQPVRKVVLTLTLHGTDMFARERSDAEGHFKFDGLPSGQYELRSAGPGELISLADGEARGDLKVRLRHPASVSGRVFDEQGGAVGGVAVTIRRPAGIEMPRITTTNDQGEYTFLEVDPGSYLLRANGIKVPGTSLGPQEYAGIVNVQPGERIPERNFHLKAEETHQIHGRAGRSAGG